MDIKSTRNINSVRNLPLPPTPPVTKPKSVKHHQRLAAERLALSGVTFHSPNNISSMHVPCQTSRKYSTDSGLASGSNNVPPSSNHDPECESNYSTPDLLSGTRDKKKTSPTSNHSVLSSSNKISLDDHLSMNEKYLSTASDKDADNEVRNILRMPCESESSWKPIDCDVDPFSGVTCQTLSLKKHESDDILHSHFSRLSTLTDLESNDERHQSKVDGQEGNFQESRINLKNDAILHVQADKPQSRDDEFVKTDENSIEGISSSDTRRSSVQYEPVVSDPTNPSPSSSLHPVGRRIIKVKRPLSSCHLETRSDVDERSEDCTIPEEEQPLNPRLREPSPASDRRSLHSQRGSSYIQRANQDRMYSSKSGTAFNEHRHPGGVPRMGTGIVQPSIAQTTYLPPASHHINQQTENAAVTPNISSNGVPDAEFFPVNSAALTLAHEEDAPGVWSFTRGAETDRSHCVNYPVAGLPSRSTIPNPTAAVPRFSNNPTSTFPNAQRFERSARSRSQTTRSCNGTFTKLCIPKCRARCSWKAVAILFIIITVILLAFIAYLAILSLSKTRPTIESSPRNDCEIIIDHPSNTPQVKVDSSNREIQLRRPILFDVSPGSFTWMQVYVEEPSHIKFNFTVSPNAQIALYGRKGLKPTHTKFDFFERIDGSLLPSPHFPSSPSHTSFLAMTTISNHSLSRLSVTTSSRLLVEFLEYMDAGTWYLAFFNDQDEEDSIELVMSISHGLARCPNSCNSNGECQEGICKCFHGFQGSDCSQVSCAVTCRGNGVYTEGKCICFSGWKGVDCAILSDHCIDPDCGGHGECSLDGECICDKGYKGETCTEFDCYDPYCSGHGICILGVCKCDRGWKGTLCSIEDDTCLPSCGGHGSFDNISKKCYCASGWSGKDCSIDLSISHTTTLPFAASCRPLCDPGHGICVDGRCRCHDGWSGEACDTRQCHVRCEEHGTCLSGQCVCNRGWNGDLCTFAGCPDDCSGNGECILNQIEEWQCNCLRGWKGPGCTVMAEVNCKDGKDNDMDTLIDCQDPDCCSLRSCSQTLQCRGSRDPSQEIVNTRRLRVIPPTASFFDRMNFLIHRNAIQINSDLSYFNPRQASVIRGRVVTSDGSPLVGVQVQVQNRPKYGTSKTRNDGWFDLLVNGGGSLKLRFQRSSFVPLSTIVFTPWNDFVVIPTITLRTLREPVGSGTKVFNGSCDVRILMPPRAMILAAITRGYTAAECSAKGSIIPETQAIRESIFIPTTQASIVYLSSRTNGYSSVLDLLLIDGKKPANLVEVKLNITVQGVLYERKFEPLSDLKFSFKWPKIDAYGQKVYGKVNAEVLIGYVYFSCSEVAWKKLRTNLYGYDPSMEKSISFWTMDIHHTYYPEKGVVYLGNGGEMRLRDQPPMITTAMGDGSPRHISCEGCDGPAQRSKLLSPVALTSDSLGNVYVGDHDVIRRLTIDGNVTRLYLSRDLPEKYFMAVNPLGDELYFSDPIQKRIYKLRHMSLPKNYHLRDLSTNYELVAGNGGTCYPLQKGNCGDGGPATAAQLISPKGITVDHSGRLYFVDGSRIRTVNPEGGIIDTFAGSLFVTGTRPLQCTGTMGLDQLELNYPTDLAFNPLDNTLYVLDDDVIILIDVSTRQASLVAGIPPHCARFVSRNPDNRDARKVHLVSPTSITVSISDGSLYVAETDQAFINRIRRIDPYTGRISTVAGTDSKCDCAAQECQCFEGDQDFARSASLHNPISITATPDGSVYVADQLNLRIRKVWHSLPFKNNNNQYEIADPNANLLYVFDANGRHMATRNVITSTQLYQFTYSNRHFLTTVTDNNGNKVRIDYSSANIPQRLVLPSGQVISLEISQKGNLDQISYGSSALASFTYFNDETGLIRSSTRGRFSTAYYVYDAQGRLVRMTSPVGSVVTLHSSANTTSNYVTMKTIATSAGDKSNLQVGVGSRNVFIVTEPGYLYDIVITLEGAMRTVYKRWTDNSISVRYLDDSELSLETKPHPLLGLTAPSLAKRTIHLPGDPLENKIEWQTRKESENGEELSNKILLGRRMRVNNRNILSLDFSQGTLKEKIYDDHTKFMLRVQYNNKGLPTQWIPNGGITPVNVTYDVRGHAITWQRGSKSELISYDSKGNPTSNRLPDGTTWRRIHGDKIVYLSLPGSSWQFVFTFNENNNLKKLAMPSGISFSVDRRVGIGFVRTTISGPDSAFTCIQDYDDYGNYLSIFYPGEKRKVLFRYDVHGHMTKILHDSTMTDMTRDPQSGELVALTTEDCTLRFHRNGPLVRRYVVTSTNNGGMLAVFNYTHDVNLRLSSVEGTINGTRLAAEDLSYNDVSGKLITFGSYRIIDVTSNFYMISDEYVTLHKQLDNDGKILRLEVTALGTEVFQMEVTYDSGGRLSRQQLRSSLENNGTRYDYSYDDIGSLLLVRRNNEIAWRYTYDSDGKLIEIIRDQVSNTLRYDRQGRLTSFGDLPYVYDQDGFLQRKGSEVFVYDSMGLLLSAYKLDNSYEINYGYDGYGRLTSRIDVIKNSVLRYLYVDIDKPDRLTHLYNVTSGHVMTLRYDAEGHLFGLDRSDGMTWSVVSDQLGTPFMVIDKAGKILKSISYSPFGKVLHDSNPNFIIIIGFRGGIYDVDTGFLHYSNRQVLAPLAQSGFSVIKPISQASSFETESNNLFNSADYDPETGQFTSSGIRQVPLFRPTSLLFRLYQVTDPANHQPIYNHMTNTNSWLKALGFQLHNVAPDPKIATRQKDKSSVECQLSHQLSSYMNLQTSTPSVLVPDTATTEETILPNGAMFAQDLTISFDHGLVSTQISDSASNDIKRFSSVLVGAQLLIGLKADSSSSMMSLTHDGKPALYLFKPASAFAKDTQTMQLTGGSGKLLRSDFNNPIDLRLLENELQAESEYAIITIYYVGHETASSYSNVKFSTEKGEREAVLATAIKQAENDAWSMEQRKIQSDMRTHWTRHQEQKILSHGHLDDYTVQLTFDPEQYPEFADSARNVQFVRKT